MGRFGYSHYRNNPSPGASLFITTTVLDFATLFSHPPLADLMTRTILTEVRQQRVRLAGFVVMPHHIHLLLALPTDVTGSRFVQGLKSKSAKQLLAFEPERIKAQIQDQMGLGQRSLWKRSFRSYELSRPGDYEQKLRYIHLNPVRAGLVTKPEDYRWSSAWMWLAGHAHDGELNVTDALIAEFSHGT